MRGKVLPECDGTLGRAQGQAKASTWPTANVISMSASPEFEALAGAAPGVPLGASLWGLDGPADDLTISTSSSRAVLLRFAWGCSSASSLLRVRSTQSEGGGLAILVCVSTSGSAFVCFHLYISWGSSSFNQLLQPTASCCGAIDSLSRYYRQAFKFLT